MLLISWNVNGLRAIRQKGFADILKKTNADVFCLQETKVSETNIDQDLKEISGYRGYFSCSQKGGYSGVAFYAKKKLLGVEQNIGLKEIDNEGRIIIADLAPKVKLLNIYFPNGKASTERLDYKMKFYKIILEYMNKLVRSATEVILCGDINTAHKEIDLARSKENQKISGFLPQERAWIDKLISEGYIDTFRYFDRRPDQYTWWDYKTGARSRNVGWRIDYFFISKNLLKKLRKSYILSDIMGSDHCPIAMELEI
ncbi:MAG: exodeoxyribonuclease III [Candidatus Margulisbacteria bacterium]|nr:exodeoxyribonuclease III [Candidatus Margulisiibacteriota bacterium]